MTVDDFQDSINLDNVHRIAIDNFKNGMEKRIGKMLTDNQVISFMLYYYSHCNVGYEHREATARALAVCLIDAADLEDDYRQEVKD